MILNVKVKNRIATYIQSEEKPVCGNSGDEVKFAFDEEWAEHEAKTARFKWNGQHHDVEFTGDTCEVPIISNASSITVGVFVGEDAEGEDEISTTDATIPYKLSTRCGRSVASANTGANYTNEARGYAAEAAASAEDAKGYMEATEGMSAEVQAKKQAEIAFHNAYYQTFLQLRNAGALPSDMDMVDTGVFDLGSGLSNPASCTGIIIEPPEEDYYDGSTEYAFAQCMVLSNIVIPYGVKRIGSDAFHGCSALERVILPSTLTELQNSVFCDCTSLKKVDIPSYGKLERIENLAFYATALESIDIPDNVTYLDTAFNDCYSLKAVNFGKNSKLEYIKEALFMAVSTKFQYFKVPKSVKSIGRMAFSNGTNTFTLDLTEYGQNTPFPTAGNAIIYNNDDMTYKTNVHILVPMGRKAELAAMTNWSQYADFIEEVEA